MTDTLNGGQNCTTCKHTEHGTLSFAITPFDSPACRSCIDMSTSANAYPGWEPETEEQMGTVESPEVQALRKLHEAALAFAKLQRFGVAMRINDVLRVIVAEEAMDLSGAEALQAQIREESERMSDWLVGRLGEESPD